MAPNRPEAGDAAEAHDTPSVLSHLEELHDLALKSKDTFRALETAIEKGMPVNRGVQDALAAHGKEVQNVVSVAEFKVKQFAPERR